MENWEIRGGYIPESESQTASKNMCITAVFSDLTELQMSF